MSEAPTPIEAPAVAETPAPTVEETALEVEIADVFGLSLEPEGKPVSEAEGGVELPVAPPPSPPVLEVPAAPVVVPTPAETPIPQAPATSELTPEQRLAANTETVTIAALQQQIADLTAKVATPAAPVEPVGNVDETDFVPPQYQLQIPDEVVNAIFDENPATAKAGMQHLVNGLAAHVHKTIMTKTVLPLLQAHEQALKRPLEASQAADQADAMKAQYYERHPTHNSPAIQAIIAAENASLGAQFPNAAWDETYMDALGARVNAKLVEMTTIVQPPIAPTPAPAKPAAMMPSTAPAPAVAVEENLGDEVFALFS